VLLCLQSMDLEATSDPTGRKPFIVVGTTVNRGEDMSTKGNVRLSTRLSQSLVLT
jgi:hypothetical protein